MSRNGTRHFADEIKRLVDYYRDEYKMTLAEVVGALHLMAFDLAHGQSHSDDDNCESGNEHEHPC